MIIFIPLLLAYTTLWFSVLIFRVPIPIPSPVLLSSAASTSPLLSLVSIVEEINVAIGSLPAVSDLVYSVAEDSRSAWYLDAPPISPIPPPSSSPLHSSSPPPSSLPPLDLPTCVPLAWPPLSDFSYLATVVCYQVSSTDLVVWDGTSNSSTFPSWFASMVDGHSPEPIWYFAALVASGVGFWLACRLIAVAILKRSVSASSEVCGHQRRWPT